MKMLIPLFVLFSVTFVHVLGGRAFEDTITEDHAYYTMSLYQVWFVENFVTCKKDCKKIALQILVYDDIICNTIQVIISLIYLVGSHFCFMFN